MIASGTLQYQLVMIFVMHAGIPIMKWKHTRKTNIYDNITLLCSYKRFRHHAAVYIVARCSRLRRTTTLKDAKWDVE